MAEQPTPQEALTEIHRHIVESYLQSILDELQSIQIILDMKTSEPGKDGQDDFDETRIAAEKHRDDLEETRKAINSLSS